MEDKNMGKKAMEDKQIKAEENLLMFGMFSIVMFFAGLTSAYIVSKKALALKWDIIKLPIMFYISTIIIVLSSFFAQYGIKYIRLHNWYNII